jgi:CO/xanthine dehydrogenase Mo-binding subunit
LQRNATESFLVVEGTPVEGPIPAIEPPAQAAQTLTATYYRPFQMHAALGPSAALAHWTQAGLTIWTHSQGIYALRSSLAEVLGLAEGQLHLTHVEGPGCYGHNGADDVALDAALLARALPGRPVLLKWKREDEHAWEPYSSAMVVQAQASLDTTGQVIDWNHDVWSYTHGSRPRPLGGSASLLLAARHLAQPLPPPPAQPGKGYHGGIHRNADPLYAFPRRRIIKHFVPDSPLRTSSMRSLGAYANVFAIESFMDELALAAGSDPLTFRLRHLQDERARAVIEAAAERAGWRAGERLPGAGQGRGRGLGFAQYKNQKCYAAVIIELSVEQDTGQIQLERAIIAADAGQVVNPDGLANQLEGGVVQAASWTLKEAVRFDQAGVISRDWQSYPILTFPETPQIETVLLNRPEQPWLGAGEATHGPTPAAIANAIFEAVGIRLREIPFTPERVRQELNHKAGGN